MFGFAHNGHRALTNQTGTAWERTPWRAAEDHGLVDNGDGPQINSHHFGTARRSSESR